MRSVRSKFVRVTFERHGYDKNQLEQVVALILQIRNGRADEAVPSRSAARQISQRFYGSGDVCRAISALRSLRVGFG